MADKQLKKLNRRELLEMLISQTRRVEMLEKQLVEAERQLQDKNLVISEAGTLADAVVKLNGVMEAAQNAAQQYLDNAKRMEQEARDLLERAKRTEGSDG